MNGEKIAVLIVDTQGLFDNETTMLLTSCIFGLSTLMSSYQVYNVKERIAEDNLQQLALFSEYGRMALKAEEDGHDAEDATAADGDDGAAEVKAGADSAGQGFVHDKAFQQLEFLVRDWPNFEEDDTTESMLQFMDEYVHDVVMKAKAAKDLMETRDQVGGRGGSAGGSARGSAGVREGVREYGGTGVRVGGWEGGRVGRSHPQTFHIRLRTVSRSPLASRKSAASCSHTRGSRSPRSRTTGR